MASEPPSPSGQGPLPLAVALTPTLPSAGIDHFIKYFPLLQCVALMLNYQNVFGLSPTGNLHTGSLSVQRKA